MTSLCTGLSAFWCPNCGTCTCTRGRDGDCFFDAEQCPLPSAQSQHAQTIELAQCEQAINALIAEFDVEVSEHDQAQLVRFAQLLYDRSRRKKPSNA